MAGDPPTSEPPTSDTPPVPTASTAKSAVPAKTSVLENLENQRKSNLDFDMDEPTLTGSSSLLLPSGSKLKGEANYQDWKASILDLANGKHLLRYLRADDKVPKEVDVIDDSDPAATKLWQRWSSSDSIMKTIIRNNCEKGEPRSLINKKKTALAMWQTFQAQYEGKGYVLKYNALQRYRSMKLSDHKDITAFNIAFNESIDARAELDMELTPRDDEMFYVMLVDPAFPMWSERQRHTARNTKTSPTLSQLQIDVVDESRKVGGTESDNTALFGGKTRGIKRGKSGNASSSRPTCTYCKQKDPFHAPENCFKVNKKKLKEWEEKNGRKWEDKTTGTKKSKDKAKKGANDDSSDDDTLSVPALSTGVPISTSYNNLSNIPASSSALIQGTFSVLDQDHWLADSGASSHICRDISLFTDYQKGSAGLPVMKTAGNTSIQGEGQGTVTLSVVRNGSKHRKLVLRDVQYIPACPINLFGGRKLIQQGGSIHKGCIMGSNGKEICEIDSNLYLREVNSTRQYHSMPVLESAELTLDDWHRRFGHISMDMIEATAKVSTGLKYVKLQEKMTRICDPCENSTPTNSVRRYVDHKVEDALGQIDIDLVTFKERAHNQHKYAMILTCKATTARWNYTFTHKDDAKNCIKKFNKMTQTQYKRTVRVWRVDGGKEYGPNQLSALTAEMGQLLEVTTPYQHNQNGTAERTNRTIISKVRTVMLDAGIPDSMWPEIVSAIVKVTNRTATRTLAGKTPYEVFMDQIDPANIGHHKPKVSHLRVLGCKSYVHIPEEKRTKRQQAGEAC